MPFHMGFSEIRAFEQQRLSRRPARRIGHSVAEVQPRRMPPLAVAPESVGGMAVFVRAEPYDRDVEGRQKPVQFGLNGIRIPPKRDSSTKPGKKAKKRGGGAALALSQGESPSRSPNGDAAKKRLTLVQEHYMNKSASSAGGAGRRFAAVRAGGVASGGNAGAKKHDI